MFADGFRNLWSSTALHIANGDALYTDWNLPALTYSGSQLTRRSYCTNSLSKVYRLPMLQLPLERLQLKDRQEKFQSSSRFQRSNSFPLPHHNTHHDRRRININSSRPLA